MVKKAFTLIELLVVVAIIGLLASVVIVSVNGARKKAQDARVKNDVQSILSAAELQLASNPTSKFTGVAISPTQANFCTSGNCTTGDNIVLTFKDESGNQLMQKAPTHPVLTYTWQTDAAGTKYIICGQLSPFDGSKYFVGQNGATFESTTGCPITP